MLFFRRILVGDQERILLIRNGSFVRVLEPGAHIIWNFGGVLEFERHDVSAVVFDGSWAAYLAKVRPNMTEHHFITVETNDRQIAVVSLDGKVARVLSPGARALFWRGPVEVSVEMFDVVISPEVPDRLVPALMSVGCDLQYLHRVLQIAVRRTLDRRTLDELLAEIAPSTNR